jgi:hypothetical protein
MFAPKIAKPITMTGKKTASNLALRRSTLVEHRLRYDPFVPPSGEPLPPSVRTYFEPRFSFDFSRVRIHAGPEAAAAARAVNAHAYTIGPNIVFGEGRYEPGTHAGKLLLAHELTHVVQQRGGAERIHRQAVTAAAAGGVAVGASDSTARLSAIIEDIERVHANAERAEDASTDDIAEFLARLRTVATSGDEQLKLAVLAGFSKQGVERAEASIPKDVAGVRESGAERFAAKSISVSSPSDPQEIEADRVAAHVVDGARATVLQTTSESVVNRQGPELVAAGFGVLAFEAESTPATSWNPPGWVFLGVATVVAAALIGAGALMATAQPETLSAAEEEAIRAKNAGEPYDPATYNRARQKQIKNEKYAKERNKQKRGG